MSLVRHGSKPLVALGALVGGCFLSNTARAQTCALEPRPTEPDSAWAIASDASSYAPPGVPLRFWYEQDGPNAPAPDPAPDPEVPQFVLDAASVALDSIAFFNDELGFRPPITDGDYPACAENGGDDRIDVYLFNFTGADGRIGLGRCDEISGECSGFMIIDHRYARYRTPLEGLNTVLPHEYFHLVQAAYGATGDAWWSEGVAQWATNAWRPDLEDLERFLPSFFEHLDRPIDLPPTAVAQPFSYGAAILPTFLAERYDRDLVREVYEQMSNTNGEATPALIAALGARDIGIRSAFTEFTLWNAATASRAGDDGYAEAERYPGVEPTQLDAADATADDPLREAVAGLSAHYYELTSNRRFWIQFDADAGRASATFIPLDNGALVLSQRVQLPGSTSGAGVVVVSSYADDRRDTWYELSLLDEQPPASENEPATGESDGASTSEQGTEDNDDSGLAKESGGCRLKPTSNGGSLLPSTGALLALVLAWRRRRDA